MSIKEDINKIVSNLGLKEDSLKILNDKPLRPKPFISDEDLRIGNLEFVALIKERKRKIEEIKKRSLA